MAWGCGWKLVAQTAGFAVCGFCLTRGCSVARGASSADLRFRSAAFHPELGRSSSNRRAAINVEECAIANKPNSSYQNGSRRHQTGIIYDPAPRGPRPKSRGPKPQARYWLLRDRDARLAENRARIDEGYAAARRGELIDADQVRAQMEEKKRAWRAEQRKA